MIVPKLTFLIVLLISYSVLTLSTVLSCVDPDYFGFYQCTKPGLVALTFDDGPSLNGNTERVLDVLREKQVKATFFITGSIDGNQSLENDQRKQFLLKKIFSEGHQIGSHTWSHPNLTETMSRQEIVNDIRHLSRTVGNILGGNMTIFRPPYGCSNKTVINLIEQEFGYEVIEWNVDTKDWLNEKNVTASMRAYEAEITMACPSDRSFIVLHHDNHPGAGELAVKAIDFVRAKGFKLVTVGECIGVAEFKHF